MNSVIIQNDLLSYNQDSLKDGGSSSPLSFSPCFQLDHHIVPTSPTLPFLPRRHSFLFSLFNFLPTLSVLPIFPLSLSFLSSHPPLSAVWPVSAALLCFFSPYKAAFMHYLSIPPSPLLHLNPSHPVFHFQPASRGRGVLIHLQARL